MQEALVLARPPGQAQQLMLLFHAAGSTAAAMAPLGAVLAREFPAAVIVGIEAPRPAEDAPGSAWYPTAGLTEENLPERVAAAMPAFVEAVRHWQRETGVGTDAVALVGLGEGGVMALESTRAGTPIAGRVVAVGGRFARLPERPNDTTTLHLFHGKRDPVLPYGFTVEAAQHLVAIGADVTADVIPFVGREIGDDVAALMIERLRGHLPRRTWAAAMRAAADLGPAGHG
jgi:phospholipase/carboxylesterase